MTLYPRIQLYSRALRWPFLTACLLPYIYGALLGRGPLNVILFWLGLAAVAATHLSANLMNDVGDADSGADDLDLTYFGFFGGSKLIQTGQLSRLHYQRLAAGFGMLGLSATMAAVWVTQNHIILPLYGMALLFSWWYTRGPWPLSYHGIGEVAVIVLFGPVVVLGAAFLQGRLPDPAAALQSLPFGLLTGGILIANEVPDCREDAEAGKRTLAVRVGRDRGHVLFAGLALAALTLVLWQVIVGVLSAWALLALSAGVPATAAWMILKRQWSNKLALMQSSRMAVATHTLASAGLIVGILLSR